MSVLVDSNSFLKGYLFQTSFHIACFVQVDDIMASGWYRMMLHDSSLRRLYLSSFVTSKKSKLPGKPLDRGLGHNL